MSPRGRIGRLGGVGRRPDHWSSPHERARIRAAERLAGPLSGQEEAWLESHLTTCESCHEIAEAYASERLLLRRLRDDQPEPPRDLWARTAAGIEREAAGRRPAARPARARRATSLPALGALSGLAVVGVVVVATAISSGLLGRPGRDPLASPPVALASPPIALPTAMAVGAGRVHWLGAGADGDFAYNVADIDVVCPYDRQPDCAPFADGNARRVALTTTPRYVYQSPVDDEAVVVGSDASGADAVLVVALPAPDPAPVASESPEASIDPAGATASTSSPPSGATPSIDLPSVPPSEAPSVSIASIDPAASGLLSPVPSHAVAVAILTDVTIVGRAAGYSADGSWFAFSARPADGSVGPDIYVWHVGDVEARALTTDHASVFASWVGGSLLGSRASQTPAPPVDPSLPSASPELPTASDGSATPEASAAVDATPAPEFLPQTFLLDPTTGLETPLLEAEWQPAVDPTELAVVSWRGTVAMAVDGLTAGPATGNLVIHPFRGPAASESPEVQPSMSLEASSIPLATASADGSPSSSPEPQVVRDFPEQIVTAGPVADFDARWDDTGSWLAIWIADPIDPGLGRLSLLHFDPFTGLLDRPPGAPQDVTALPGFSIGRGRLAWASPPGQGGEGSRIQIAAWISNEVGAVESIPVEHAIIVQ